MKHLIKQYSRFLGEYNHLIKAFPNSLNCFYQSNDLTQLQKEFPDSSLKASSEYSGLAFLFITLKKQMIR